MPPKKTGNASAEGSDATASAVTVLCHLIMSCDDFKADNSKLAPILGIAQAKNVPRKINSVISPYGFEFKNGNVLCRDGQGQVAEEKATSHIHTGTKGGGSGAAMEGKKDQNANAKGKAKSKAKGQVTASKKRKLAAVEAEDAGAVADADANEHEGEDEHEGNYEAE
ncbi:hypothetical protein VPNG_10187 [Cytospora leucostoma]|uniref:Uncharacterized protein n=1 Tax=Cytospora leucostoma TaxID=1230097 RepID=A0A423VFM4_9PEZI|nr:hypothetical protein VPNG_10187 [Cytospora leucostoma]